MVRIIIMIIIINNNNDYYNNNRDRDENDDYKMFDYKNHQTAVSFSIHTV